ncbi:DUF3087 domain-containing protein [Colwellia sp. M166]|uniref:DUF3087 domain-containing protein n=1 Tax=Colwellia sp. M166 TaxID=2583805 RepID=UPI00211F3551|nr:DUF3087 domain-containing protein [Colwellia sp. M166]UUO25149.1 DUF3087 domain-containing protein [Colwellia sp. M166]|tara:strand:+ start:3770 stop:4351 length:582 start_codon:yes stop_codon:yes gene_type:complete
MKLKDIEKSVYRKHLNIIIVSFIASLLILALAYGQGLIMLFADTAIISPEPTIIATGEVAGELASDAAATDSNFSYNFLGVLLALLSCVFALHRLRSSAFFNEVYYVWQVKQQQNLIYRKLKKIKAAADNEDVNALIILHFYYTSLKQIYLLDDNTLTISKLNKDLSELNTRLENKNLTISTDQFDKSMLSDY